jgi:hypothetical protein
MNKLIFIIILFFVNFKSYAESGAGIEGGLAYGDIGAEETAQRIANIAGSSVLVEYDRATWYGRLFYDLEISNDTFIDFGYFMTGPLDAKYTLSGSSATEGYSFNGLEASYGFKSDGFFFKGGVHQSQVDGVASITIGSTIYAAKASAEGTGYLLGGGIEEDKFRYGITYYNSLGGIEDTNLLVGYYGIKF